MNSLPPAFPPQTVSLTSAQHQRLALLDESCAVIGHEGDSPVVRHSSGRLSTVDVDGTLRRATSRARERMEQRMIDFVLPRVRG